MRTNRREFVSGAMALGAMGCCTKAFGDERVGKAWDGWRKGHFQIHMVYTGVAESLFLIFPDGTTMLLDCGDHPACARGKMAVPIRPNTKVHAGETIARYVLRVNPNGSEVDYMMLSHYHSDHAGCMSFHAGKAPNGKYVLSGFGQAMEYLTFRRAIDRAWPNYNDPFPMADKYDGGVVGQMREVYAELARRGTIIEKFRLVSPSDQIRPLRGEAKGFSVRPLCANGKVLMPDGTIEDTLSMKGRGRWHNENLLSIGMMFGWGPFRFFTAGDFADHFIDGNGERVEAENVLAKACGRADVAKLNHHGHHSMPPKLVAALKSKVYLANIWDQFHVTRDTMRNLANRRLYPGERRFYPGVLPIERQREDAAELWFRDVEPAVFNCSHVVVDVEPDGKTYSVATITAEDETMKVTSRTRFDVG